VISSASTGWAANGLLVEGTAMAEETPPDPVQEEPQEEFFDNQPTDVEVEETESAREEGASSKPWDPSKIRISTKPFSLRQIVDMIEDGDIDLAPDFQRLFVWKPKERSRLIESILLGIPLPAFYFNQDPEGSMQVVDGVQRLTTIHEFAKKGWRLVDLEYLNELVNNSFDDMEVSFRRRFQQTQIFVNIIEPQTPDDVKFDVFRRINTGGGLLTAQEIRHCMSRRRSREFLKRLIELPSFHVATDHAFKNEHRMADREVVLRFLAFRHLGELEGYRKFENLDSFLLDFTRQIDGFQSHKPRIDGAGLERLAADFERAMKSAATVFGNAAFRKYPEGATKRGPINRALFESWSVALADHESDSLQPHAHTVLKHARARMKEEKYAAAITLATGDHSKVLLRFSVARDILQQAVQ
jgi:hypothetical protein